MRRTRELCGLLFMFNSMCPAARCAGMGRRLRRHPLGTDSAVTLLWVQTPVLLPAHTLQGQERGCGPLQGLHGPGVAAPLDVHRYALGGGGCAAWVCWTARSVVQPISRA